MTEPQVETKAKRRSLWRSPKDPNYSDDWYTPPELVRALGKFDLDPSAASFSEVNHAEENWRWPAIDGLTRDWFGRVWLNPPYSNVGTWLQKMVEHGNGIALVNSWTERKWFQISLAASSGALFLRQRIKFVRPSGPAGHGCIGSVLIAYGKPNARALIRSGLEGIFLPGPSSPIPAPGREPMH